MPKHRDEKFRGTTLILKNSRILSAAILKHFFCVTCRKRHILLQKISVSDMQLRREIRLLPFLKGAYSRRPSLSGSSAVLYWTPSSLLTGNYSNMGFQKLQEFFCVWCNFLLSADKADGNHFIIFHFKDNIQAIGVAAQLLSLFLGNPISAIFRRTIGFKIFIRQKGSLFLWAVLCLTPTEKIKWSAAFPKLQEIQGRKKWKIYHNPPVCAKIAWEQSVWFRNENLTFFRQRKHTCQKLWKKI